MTRKIIKNYKKPNGLPLALYIRHHRLGIDETLYYFENLGTVSRNVFTRDEGTQFYHKKRDDKK